MDKKIKQEQQRAIVAEAAWVVLVSSSSRLWEVVLSLSSALLGLHLEYSFQFGLPSTRSTFHLSEILEQAQWVPLRWSGGWRTWHVGRD